MSSPMPGYEHQQGHVGERGNGDLVLAGSDGLDEDRIAAGGLENLCGGGRARGQPAGVAAREAMLRT